MEEYVLASDLVRNAEWDNDNKVWEIEDDAMDMMLKSAVVAEQVVHAHWRIRHISSNHYQCSRCGRFAAIEEPYCHCGAKMDEIVNW